MAIPIVNARREIVGFTNSGNLRYAESLLRGEVKLAYVEIESEADGRKAGAPDDWKGPWWCRAFCSAEVVSPDPNGGVTVIWIPKQG